MSIEETIENDGIGPEETIETPENTETPTETPEPTPEDKPEPTLKEKISELAAKKEEKGGKSAAGEEAPAYSPNFKFKVLDKEQEIPQEFRSLIKDEKSEKMVREIFEKANGLDGVKASRDALKEEISTVKHENTQIKAGIDGIRQIYQSAKQSGNLLKLDEFFDRLSIPHQDILQYALAKVNLSNLTPEQRQAVMGQMESDRRAEQAEQQIRSERTQNQTLGQRVRQMELTSEMSKPDVKAIADAFDAQAGKPGAFFDQVANTGQLAWHREQVDLSVQDAVKRTIANLGLKAPTSAPAAAAATGGAATPPEKRIIQRESKTIPNIQGRAASPLKKGPRSIEDLKELQKQYAKQA